MHIPDGFLNVKTWAAAWFLSSCAMGYCIKQTTRLLKERMIPLMGVMSAFIFSAQMFNFPVIAGTSGHLLGGVLAAVLLGPNPAAICLTCVLIVQCLVFQDGGLTALGANILNISFVGTFGGYSAYRIIRNFIGGRKGIIVGAGVAGWFSVVLSSVACAIELGISGTAPFKVVLFAMSGVHALIGVIEAIITGLIVSFVLKVRPDLVYNGECGQ